MPQICPAVPLIRFVEALMLVQAQSRAKRNVFNVGNVVKQLIWTRMM